MDYKTKSNVLKRSQVDILVSLLREYPIIGAVNLEGLPTPQLQTMREKLRGSVVLNMAKKNILKIAIDQVKAEKPGLEELSGHLKGMPALLFTKDNPFSLFKVLQKNKSSAPAKAGQEAPKEIVVPAGPTPFAPGPIIGELGSFRIKTGVENGKVAIQADAVVAKAGDVLSAALAGLLTRLGIEPMEVGLALTAVYDEGTVYTRSVLDVDETHIQAQADLFAIQAFNLAMNAGIFVKETVAPLLGKAATEARNLAMEANIITSDTVGDILAKAQAQATSLQVLQK
jgi:large subunit ribosomal protein L10